MILAGDIGGTKSKLAVFEPAGEKLCCVAQQRFASQNFARCEDVVAQFTQQGKFRITAAGFGVAGPVIGNQVRATNLPWIVDGAALARLLGLKRVILLNDLEATAHGLELLDSNELRAVNAGAPDANANQALIAAGTGLGEAIIFRREGQRLVSPGEGGHTDFAPRTEEEIELLRFLKKRHRQVSWEQVLSGKGFRAMHEFLAPGVKHPSFEDPEADPAPEITQHALAATCPACVSAVDLWAALYGAEAGNLAMKALARGGVYVAGGIAAKLAGKLCEGRFFEAFCDKSKFESLLRQIPVHIVLNEDTPVLGAAVVAMRRDEAS